MSHSHAFNSSDGINRVQRNLGPFNSYQLKSDLTLEERIYLFCELMKQGVNKSNPALIEPLGLNLSPLRHKPGSGDGGANMTMLSERY